MLCLQTFLRALLAQLTNCVEVKSKKEEGKKTVLLIVQISVLFFLTHFLPFHTCNTVLIDAHTCESSITEQPDLAFFAVYDGHGGKTASTLRYVYRVVLSVRNQNKQIYQE